MGLLFSARIYLAYSTAFNPLGFVWLCYPFCPLFVVLCALLHVSAHSAGFRRSGQNAEHAPQSSADSRPIGKWDQGLLAGTTDNGPRTKDQEIMSLIIKRLPEIGRAIMLGHLLSY